MPELPDIIVYVRALESHVVGEPLERLRLGSPFALRSIDPPPAAVAGKPVTGVRRLGKRIVVGLDGNLFVVMHLMIAGRLRWRKPNATLPKKRGVAALDFAAGTVLFTEEGTQRHAGLWMVRGDAALHAHDPGGLEVLEADPDQFRTALTRENHTLKRALSDPTILSGVGNAYSDEILHAARLSPLQLTRNLSDAELERLYHAARSTLSAWIGRLTAQVGDGFPEKVTAFRDGMAVHGRYREPCPVCGSPVQRLRYAQNEANYCARCQTGGNVLADRAYSRLLRDDWPRTLEEWESRFEVRR